MALIAKWLPRHPTSITVPPGISDIVFRMGNAFSYQYETNESNAAPVAYGTRFNIKNSVSYSWKIDR
jgi:hypothetical protein